MDCSEAERLLSERHLPDLAAEERRALGIHMGGCAACKARWGLDFESQAFHDILGGVLPRVESVQDDVVAQLELGLGPSGFADLEERVKEALGAHGLEVLSRLGRGGMGVVYKARQAHMNRDVALKVLAPHLADDREYVRRFVQEARAAARLRHPNVVQAHDIVAAGGTLFLVMEYVEGSSLAALIAREGTLPAERARGYMLQVARALAAAHEAGILHRDVKPSNILIDRRDTARVADFGLAKLPDSQLATTAAGQVLGTPAYLSPEAARGRPADPRSDLYSLGATFYHALAGHPPFQARTLVELARQHSHETPASLARAAPRADPRLCRIIDRLLSKQPEKRYPSAEAVLRDLEGLGPVADAPAPRPARSRRLLRALAVAAALALVAAALALLRPWRARTAPQPPGIELFNGTSLDGWSIARGGFFFEGGTVRVQDGAIVLSADGDLAAGIACTRDVPRDNYEILFEAMRSRGQGNAASLAFPLGPQSCSWSIGNLARSCGLEVIDGRGDHDPDNPTRQYHTFTNGRWYDFRLRVQNGRVRAWIDGAQVVDFLPQGHRVEVWDGYAAVLPLGFYAARFTEARLRGITLRPLPSEPESPD